MITALERQDSKVKEFMQAILRGVEAWKQAGEILVEMLREDPDAKEKIVRMHPEISLGVLSTLEKVGRGEITPRLLVADCPGYVAARRLPLSDQERCLEEDKLDLVVLHEGRVDVLKVDPRSLTKEQARQVFASDHIRDQGEQRAWMEAQQQRKKEKAFKRGYTIKDGEVVFQRHARLTAHEIAHLLEELQK